MKISTILLTIFLFFTGCSQKESEEVASVKPYAVGDIITLEGVEGGEKKIKRVNHGFVLVGDEKKIIIFDIFGTFCPPCQEEAPNLTNFQIKNSDKVAIIGLTYLEEVTNSYVVDNFSNRYNAHYFISNSKENTRIIATILEDIKYPIALQIPFKVVLKEGIYQELTDVWEQKEGIKFYLGNVGIRTIEYDLNTITQ